MTAVRLQPHRLIPKPDATREQRIERSYEMLVRTFHLRTLVAFVGSGCSAPLGYPSWLELAEKLIQKALALPQDRLAVQRLEKLKESLKGKVGPEDLMFIIAACRRVFSTDKTIYWQYFKEEFSLEREIGKGTNPHRSLMNLPVHRFVTTNYDCEVERALSDVRKVELTDFGIQGQGISPGRQVRPRSFTQRPEYHDQLALFSLARVEEAQNLVFHCHGRYDDPESIIATEADYQRWYLSDQDGGIFRQTIDLLLSSNPILFVGYSLGDEDLMRQLRLLSALNPERKHSRPLFALLAEPEEGMHWSYHERLFDRYGLNVLPYTDPDSTDDSASKNQDIDKEAKRLRRGKILCKTIADLKERSLSTRLRWLDKPFFRKVEVPVKVSQQYSQEPYFYRGFDLPLGGGAESGIAPCLGEDRLQKNLDELRDSLLKGNEGILVLIGPGGTGKSLYALRLIEEVRKASEDAAEPYTGFFFWSSYYADDALSGIDRLLSYLRSEAPQKSRIERLEEALRKGGRYLIVLDGFDRLLRPGNEPDTGVVSNAWIARLLSLFVESSGPPHNTLVLTTRLWPGLLDDLDKTRSRVKRFSLERMRTEDIRPAFSFLKLQELADVSALCSLLEGHTYALLLATRLLEKCDESLREQRLQNLICSLAGTPPDRRVSRLIEELIGDLDRSSEGSALRLLERLAIFMSPVTEETLDLCYRLVRSPEPRDRLVRTLIEGRLLFEHRRPDGKEILGYTVHPMVRSFVFERVHRVERDTLPSFSLPGFTSGTASVYPGLPEKAKVVVDLFNLLYKAAEEALATGDLERARELCRNLFGVMRSRMESNTAPRWRSYNDYLDFGVRLIDLAKQLSPRLWRYRERHEGTEIEDLNAPLYGDELAWLYNDVGLTLCAEGQMVDCYAIWEQGYEINRLLEGSSPVPRYCLQSQLHLAHTFLELGKLQAADHFLDETESTNRKVGEKDYAGRIEGYRAVVAHLRGNLQQAEDLFESALAKLKGTANSRATSFFLGYWAALQVRLKRFEEADKSIQTSLALAETGGYPDLVAYARLSAGKLYRAQNKLREATLEYHTVLEEARRIGIGRLESEVLAELSRLALGLGDAEIARQRAMESLRVANSLGLGLRQTHALVVLGLATTAAGQRDLGVSYLKHARTLAARQGYWLRSSEAEEHLRWLGEEQATQSRLFSLSTPLP